MKIEQVRAIAIKKGISNYDLFVDFIMKRFPTESMESYVSEWADRFLSCNPAAYMDLDSKEIYISLL